MAVGEGGGSAADQLISTACALGSTTIDLSRKNLTEIPKEVLDLQQLEFLYLEGNSISSVPEELFQKLSSLRWLDLRNNRLSEIPSVAGEHRNLRNLLLEGNNIRMLPLELGFIKSLSGLNLTGNPLEFPPPQVIERGTQEILKFLREHYLARLEDSEGRNHRVSPDSSSGEELSEEAPPNYENDIKRLHIREEPVDEKQEENYHVERVRLPPIIQAAASRPRNRSNEETQDLLRGHKAMQFEPEKSFRNNIQLGEDEQKPTKRPQRCTEAQLVKRDVLKKTETKDYKGHLEPIDKKKISKLKMDSTTEERSETQSEEKLKSHGNAKKSRKKKSPRKENPIPESYQKNGFTRTDVEKPSKSLKGNTTNADTAELQKKIEHTSHTKETPKELAHEPWSASIHEGDMVALKVPEKLFIKGQPCLGKVTSLADRAGLITVHYYTGTYNGHWRPMMSRTSPYLRKVPLVNILCKFCLSADGRMSPVTAAKVRKMVDRLSGMQT